MSVYVYSTITASQKYAVWLASEHGIPQVKYFIWVQGGANLPSKHFVTPQGVVTEVSDEDYELLQQNEVFKIHLAAGHLKIERRKASVEKVVSGMEAKDGSAPLTPDEYIARGDKPPETKVSSDSGFQSEVQRSQASADSSSQPEPTPKRRGRPPKAA